MENMSVWWLVGAGVVLAGLLIVFAFAAFSVSQRVDGDDPTMDFGFDTQRQPPRPYNSGIRPNSPWLDDRLKEQQEGSIAARAAREAVHETAQQDDAMRALGRIYEKVTGCSVEGAVDDPRVLAGAVLSIWDETRTGERNLHQTVEVIAHFTADPWTEHVARVAWADPRRMEAIEEAIATDARPDKEQGNE